VGVADRSRARLPLLVLGFLTDCGVVVGWSRERFPVPTERLNRIVCWVCLRGGVGVVDGTRARLPVLAWTPRGSVGLVSWWDCGSASGDPWMWLPVLLLPLDGVGRLEVGKIGESTVDGCW
jgi:hypothetical protein